MARHTSPIEATIIDYLHRNGGEGDRQALIDAMALLTDYADSSVRHALCDMARDGVVARDGRLFSIDYDGDASGDESLGAAAGE